MFGWFTPKESQTSFVCTYCQSTLIPLIDLPSFVIEAVRYSGFVCERCQVIESEEHVERIFDIKGKPLRITYSEYLKSPQWKTIKGLALEFAQNRCQVCNSDLMLNVHHRKYPEVLGMEEPTDLTVLCRRCHDLFHNPRKAK